MKTSIFKNSILPSLLLALPLLASQAPVAAQIPPTNGHWEVNHYERVGVDHGPSSWHYWQWDTPDYTWRDDDCLPYGIYGARTDWSPDKWAYWFYGAPFVRAHTQSYQKGSVTPWITWVPDKDANGNPVPDSQPSKIFWYRESSSATAQGSLASQLSASNGLGSPNWTFTDPFPDLPVFSQSYGTPRMHALGASGYKVTKQVNYDPNRRNAIRLSTRELSVESMVPASDTDPQIALTTTALWYQAKQVNYNLWSDIEESKYAFFDPETSWEPWSHDVAAPGHVDQWPWVNEPDRKKLDTIAERVKPRAKIDGVTNPYPHPVFPDGYYATGLFRVDQDAIDNPHYVWSVPGDLRGTVVERLAASNTTGQNSQLDIAPNAEDRKWQGGQAGAFEYEGMPSTALFLGATLTGPVTKTIMVDVSDSSPDAVPNQITGKFQVTWHLQRENFVKYRSDTPTDFYRFIPTLPVEKCFENTVCEGVVFQWDTLLYRVSSTIAEWTSPIADIFSSIGAELGFINLFTGQMEKATTPPSYGVAFNDVWGLDDSRILEPPGMDFGSVPLTQRGYYSMTPTFMVEYFDRFLEAEMYGKHGYEGRERREHRIWTGNKHAAGDFKWDTSDPGVLPPPTPTPAPSP